MLPPQATWGIMRIKLREVLKIFVHDGITFSYYQHWLINIDFYEVMLKVFLAIPAKASQANRPILTLISKLLEFIK